MGAGVGSDTDSGSNGASGLKSAVHGHTEDIINVVGQALGVEKGAFLVVVHGELATGHLDHAVVDSLVGDEHCLVVGILD